MLIANPIYDVVFKYLMEDNKIAKLIISKIINEEIIELTPRPQENIIHLPEKSFFSIYHLDYSAVIKTPEGSKNVIIEIQKAKFLTDIMRFRMYLGSQYYDQQNQYEENGRKWNKMNRLFFKINILFTEYLKKSIILKYYSYR